MEADDDTSADLAVDLFRGTTCPPKLFTPNKFPASTSSTFNARSFPQSQGGGSLLQSYGTFFKLDTFECPICHKEYVDEKECIKCNANHNSKHICLVCKLFFKQRFPSLNTKLVALQEESQSSSSVGPATNATNITPVFSNTRLRLVHVKLFHAGVGCPTAEARS